MMHMKQIYLYVVSNRKTFLGNIFILHTALFQIKMLPKKSFKVILPHVYAYTSSISCIHRIHTVHI